MFIINILSLPTILFVIAEFPDGPASLHPPPLSSETENGIVGAAAGGVPRRHSRGKSVTSKSEMMSRSSSSKARMEYILQKSGLDAGTIHDGSKLGADTGGTGANIPSTGTDINTTNLHTGTASGTKDPNSGTRSGSVTTKPQSPLVPRSIALMSPKHHKSPTVTGASGLALEREAASSKSHHHHALTRPHSSYIVRGNTGLSSFVAASAATPGDSTSPSFFIGGTSTTNTTVSGSASPTIPVNSDHNIRARVTSTASPMTQPPSSSPLEINRLSSSLANTSPLRSEPPPTALSLDNNNISAAAASPSALSQSLGDFSPAAPVDTMPAKESSKFKESRSDSVSMVSNLASSGRDKEREVSMRKGSEPPPSLQAIFSRESMGSSRRWSNRFNVDEIHSAMHPKQQSLDSYLSQVPLSSKYRKVKTTSTSEKNAAPMMPARVESSSTSTSAAVTSVSLIPSTASIPSSMVTLEEEMGERGGREGTKHTPSYSRLNCSPRVPSSSVSLSSSLDSSMPIALAMSSQHLSMVDDCDESASLPLPRPTRSKSGSNMDLIASECDRPGSLSGLRSLKDEEHSQSRNNLDESKNPLLEPGGMKRVGSQEFLGEETLSKVTTIQPLAKGSNLSLSVTSSPVVGGWTSLDINRESLVGNTPLKDMLSGTERGVASRRASVTQVGEGVTVCGVVWVCVCLCVCVICECDL